MNLRIFLSYRRDDSSHIAGRFTEVLRKTFGHGSVFYDVESIQLGAHLFRSIERGIERSDVVIFLIGAGWQADRLNKQDDYIRFELMESLRLGKPILPVLLDNTAMPEMAALPVPLNFLASLNAGNLRRDPNFDGDSRDVIDSIRRLPRIGSGNFGVKVVEMCQRRGILITREIGELEEGKVYGALIDNDVRLRRLAALKVAHDRFTQILDALGPELYRASAILSGLDAKVSCGELLNEDESETWYRKSARQRELAAILERAVTELERDLRDIDLS